MKIISNGQRWAIRSKLEKKFLDIPTSSGIYLWTRTEGEFTYFYIGKAKNLRNRRVDYEMVISKINHPTRHFEASLRAHNDWKYQIIEKDLLIDKLDEREQYWFKFYLAKGWITRNEMSGGTTNSEKVGSDTVHSNYKRIKRMEEKYYEKLKSYKNHLNISGTSDTIMFRAKYKKDGTPTEMSRKKLGEICELFDIINNEK